WTSPKDSEVGLTSSAPCRPVPARARLGALAVASVSNDRVAGAAPATLGVQLTLMVQLAPTAMEAPQSVERLYAGSLIAMFASEPGAEPSLTSVTVSGPAVWPTWTSPKASEVGLTSREPWRP